MSATMRNSFGMTGVRLIASLLSLRGALLFAQSGEDWPQIATQRVYTGLGTVTHVTNAGDASNRLFLVQQSGRIRIGKDGTLLPAAFLDLSAKISTGGERGLLGLAFSPGYGAKGTFYVNYTNPQGNSTISRFRVSANPDVADPASEEILLVIAQPYANHNGGDLVFGPDGYLYIGMGDGGSGGDPQNRAQNPQELLGKMLRIDVESGTKPYAVPPSNPFVGNTAYKPEIWALGLRNPWRYAFDPLTKDLYIADVGQNQYEEVDFQSGGSRGGENYGWRVMEGLHCYGASTCNQTGLVKPVAEYDHGQGCSITGGFVYRGKRFSRLWGLYFYGDYCSGRIWALRKNGATWQTKELAKTSFAITTFGEDEAGELYLADATTGGVYAVSDALGTTSTQIVPILLDVNGRNGARFTSELTLANRGTSPATATLTYTAASALGASGSGSVTETVPAKRQLVFSDALTWLRQKGLAIPAGPGQGGTLRIVWSGLSSPNAAFAGARTTTPSGPGRAGLSYPAVRVQDAFTSMAEVFGLRETTNDRSNLALVNAGTLGTLTLEVTLFSGDGGGRITVLPGPVSLEPGQWTQIGSVLSHAGFTNGFALVERVSGSDPFLAYAAINDNVTGDGSYVAAVPVNRKAAAQILPVLVETPTFESELVLSNPFSFAVKASLRFFGALTVPLAAHEQRIIPRAVDFFRSQGVPVPPRGGTITQTLLVDSFLAGSVPVDGFVGARTSAAAAGGGEYGLFYTGVPVDAPANDAWIFGLKQDDFSRSNVAFAGEGITTLTVTAFDGDTSQQIQPTAVNVVVGGAYAVQLNGYPGLRNAYLHVVRNTGAGPLVCYGVVNDGPAPGAPNGTNDGSYLAMVPGD